MASGTTATRSNERARTCIAEPFGDVLGHPMTDRKRKVWHLLMLTSFESLFVRWTAGASSHALPSARLQHGAIARLWDLGPTRAYSLFMRSDRSAFGGIRSGYWLVPVSSMTLPARSTLILIGALGGAAANRLRICSMFSSDTTGMSSTERI